VYPCGASALPTGLPVIDFSVSFANDDDDDDARPTKFPTLDIANIERTLPLVGRIAGDITLEQLLHPKEHAKGDG
jgi:hypothetical protein